VTTVLANFSLSSNEKIVRILCIFVLGSFVSLSSPYSHYFTTTDVVGSFLPTMVVAMVLIIPLILVWERKSTIRKRIDFVTVYGLRIVLVAVFAHHLGKFFVLHYNWDSNDNDYNDDQNQLLLDENTKFQQTLFAMMEAAIVAATGFAATGSFRGEITKKEKLETLVEERTKTIQEKSKTLAMVTMALQASETAIVITDYSRCIVWWNASFERLATTTTTTLSSSDGTTGTGTSSSSTTTNTQLMIGVPLLDALDFQTEDDRCYLAGAFGSSTYRSHDSITISNLTFSLEVSPFNDEEHNTDTILSSISTSISTSPISSLLATTNTTTNTDRFLVVFKDTTADRARQRAEDIAREESMMAKAMGDSMVTLTHELRTPLQGIMGITSIMLDAGQGETGGDGGSRGCSRHDDHDNNNNNNNNKDICVYNNDQQQHHYQQKQQNQQQLSSDAMESLNMIMASSSLLLNLINNLLDVKKATSKMLEEFPLTSITAANPIKDSITFCLPLALISSVELVPDIASAPNAIVRSNSLRLQQILINLVSNAIKYTASGSKIFVRTRQSTMSDVRSRMDLSLASSRDAKSCDTAINSSSSSSNNSQNNNDVDDDAPVLIFSVTDRGPGVAKNQSHQLFRRFAQLADNQPNRTLGSSKIGQPSGTGLGLHLCHLFVQRMNGFMWVTNNSDDDDNNNNDGERTKRGSTFYFFLPLLSNVLSSPQSSLSNEQNTDHTSVSFRTNHHYLTDNKDYTIHSVYQRRILFVDDTLINRKVLSRILEKIGFSDVTTVDSGENAMIEIMSKKKRKSKKKRNFYYDLVISDLQMPGMSGTELCEAIGKVSSTADFPRPIVVGLTADTGLNVAKRCQASGMSDVLYKPITVKEMKQYAETKIPLLSPGVWYDTEKDHRRQNKPYHTQASSQQHTVSQ